MIVQHIGTISIRGSMTNYSPLYICHINPAARGWLSCDWYSWDSIRCIWLQALVTPDMRHP